MVRRSIPSARQHDDNRHCLAVLLGQDSHHVFDRSRFAFVPGRLVVLLGVLGSFHGERAWPATSTLRRDPAAFRERTLH